MTCEYCVSLGGELLWQGAQCRIVLAAEPDFLGFCRVIWQQHKREMTDLTKDEQMLFMTMVLGVENVLREVLKPDKINLASLGNQTPHLHWHIIPRFVDDSHYPHPIWAAPLRPAPGRALTVEQRERLRLSFIERFGISVPS